jgi:uncharacterized tellurite resistance protein B-like protein
MMSDGFFARIKDMIAREKAVRLVAEDPVLTAELILLFRVILADGVASESELAMFRQICSSAFGIPSDAIEEIGEYLSEISYETTSQQAASVFADMTPERRKLLVEHMVQIAEADHRTTRNELQLIEAVASKLGFEISLPS